MKVLGLGRAAGAHLGAIGVQFRGRRSSGSSDGGSEGAARAQARGCGVYRGAGRSHKHSRGAGRGYRGEMGDVGAQVGTTEEHWGHRGSGGAVGAMRALGAQPGAVRG